MTENCTIRPAHSRDAATIAAFNQAMARETEGKELSPEVLAAGVEALFDRPEFGFYLLAEIEKTVAGCLMITYEWSDWRNGPFWWVQSVYVKPEYRRRGVYRRLYEEVKKRAAREGDVRGIRLYVEKENIRAQGTYQSLGMRETPYQMYEELL